MCHLPHASSPLACLTSASRIRRAIHPTRMGPHPHGASTHLLSRLLESRSYSQVALTGLIHRSHSQPPILTGRVSSRSQAGEFAAVRAGRRRDHCQDLRLRCSPPMCSSRMRAADVARLFARPAHALHSLERVVCRAVRRSGARWHPFRTAGHVGILGARDVPEQAWAAGRDRWA
jgi:hypothetical protein